jgi:hypothetical protein
MRSKSPIRQSKPKTALGQRIHEPLPKPGGDQELKRRSSVPDRAVAAHSRVRITSKVCI